MSGLSGPPPLRYALAGALVIVPNRSLGPGSVREIEREATAMLAANGAARIVLDLIAVSASQDSEMTALFGAVHRLRRRGAAIAVVGAQPRVRVLLDALALDEVVVTTTVREALIALDQSAARRILPLLGGGPQTQTSRQTQCSPGQGQGQGPGQRLLDDGGVIRDRAPSLLGHESRGGPTAS